MAYKIVYTADLHGNKEFYKKLLNKAKDTDIRAVVIGGDLCPRGGSTIEKAVEIQREFIEEFMLPLFKNFNKDIFLIMGNDDFRSNSKLVANSFVRYINKKSVRITNKLYIAGYSFVNPTPFRLKDWEKEEGIKTENPSQIIPGEVRSAEKEEGTIKDDMDKLRTLSSPKKTIYVIHAPPFNTKLDVITDDTHVGSRAVRQFIEKEQPLLTLHGHIHESPKMSGSWQDKIGETICINVGSSYPEDKLNIAVIDLENLNNIEYIEI